MNFTKTSFFSENGGRKKKVKQQKSVKCKSHIGNSEKRKGFPYHSSEQQEAKCEETQIFQVLYEDSNLMPCS